MEAYADYSQNNGMFGLNAGSIVTELQAMSEPGMVYKRGNIPLKPPPPVFAVSVTPIFCKNAQDIITYGIDLNSTDTDCQGVLIMQAKQAGCYMAVLLEEPELAPAMILGASIQNKGTYYSDIATAQGCSLKTSIKFRRHWSRQGFPALN